jgi:hypothetical protein
VTGQAIQRARAPASRGPADLTALSGFLLVAISVMSVAALVFVRHAHTGAGGHGYWTDILGFRAGVDNIGIGTIVTIFASGDLHWKHNVVVLAAILIGVAGLAISRHAWLRAPRS